MTDSQMNVQVPKRLEKLVANPADKKRYSLFYGLLAGLFFAVGAFAVDAFILSGANGLFPFTKFLLALPGFLIIGFLAGWLSGLLEKMLFAGLLWGAAGFLFGKLFSFVSFQGVSLYYQRFQPKLFSLIDYSSNAGVETRLNLFVIAVTVFGLLAGLLYSNLVDESATSGYPFRRWAPLLIWIAAFWGLGMLGDNLINQSQRLPVTMLDNVIQYQLDHYDEEIAPEIVRELHLRSLGPIGDTLQNPRKLIIRDYDKMFVIVNVLVDFDGTWVSCSMLNGQGGTCELIE